MGYKRKARIVFLAGSDGSFAAMAAGFANALGAKRMEGKAAAFSHAPLASAAIAAMNESGISLATENFSAPEAKLLQWADLVVTLDAVAEKCCPPLPAHVQKKHYPFETVEESNIAAYRKVRDAIRERIEGMIGGMAMLENNVR